MLADAVEEEPEAVAEPLGGSGGKAVANFGSAATAADVAAIYPGRRPVNGSLRSSVGTTPATCPPATTTSGLSKPGPRRHGLVGTLVPGARSKIPPGRSTFE